MRLQVGAVVDGEMDLPGDLLLAGRARLLGPLTIARDMGVIVLDPVVEHQLQLAKVLGRFVVMMVVVVPVAVRMSLVHGVLSSFEMAGMPGMFVLMVVVCRVLAMDMARVGVMPVGVLMFVTVRMAMGLRTVAVFVHVQMLMPLEGKRQFEIVLLEKAFVRQDILRRTVSDHDPVADHDAAAADIEDHVQVMGRDDLGVPETLQKIDEGPP